MTLNARASFAARRALEILMLVLLLLSTAAAGPLSLGRERPKEYWAEKGKPSKAAAAKVGDALKRAALPETSKAWMTLAEQYSRLDHLAQAEPAAYEGTDKETKAAWMSHGMPHLYDILHVALKNETFIKELWSSKGLKGDAAEQAYRDLLLAIIGHDSQQVDFASPNKEKREEARLNHAFLGGVEAARAYLADPGTNPAGKVRALTLGLAAAGHSKSAVKLGNPAQMAEVVNNLATALGVTVTPAEVAKIIADAKPVAAMVGAIDALRERGALGGAVAPCGENVIYRIRTTPPPASEVFNTKTDKVLKTFEGVGHRTFVEVHTKVSSVQFEDGRIRLAVEFADTRIPNEGRLDQIKDIALDLIRLGIPVDAHWANESGGYEKKTWDAE